MGYTVLSVSGGEPMSYRALPQILAHAKADGQRTLVTTNGMLSTPRRLEQLAPHLDLLAMSLDGPPEEHDLMRAHQGAFDAMVRGLEAVRASGVPFGFLFTLTQHNVHQLEWAADFAVAQGASLLQVHPLEATGRGSALADSVPDDVESGYAALEVARLRQVWGPRLRIHLDLAGRAAVAATVMAMPEEVSARRLGETLSPLVVEPDGWCGPLEYGFPRDFGLGDVRTNLLPELAQAWVVEVYPRFRDVVAASLPPETSTRNSPITYWYASVQSAAQRASERASNR
jgi:hypothetical protein